MCVEIVSRQRLKIPRPILPASAAFFFLDKAHFPRYQKRIALIDGVTRETNFTILHLSLFSIEPQRGQCYYLRRPFRAAFLRSFLDLCAKMYKLKRHAAIHADNILTRKKKARQRNNKKRRLPYHPPTPKSSKALSFSGTI